MGCAGTGQSVKGHVGSNPSGQNERDAYPIPPQLRTDSIEKSVQGMFGSARTRTPGQSKFAEHAGDNNELSLPPFALGRKKSLGESERAQIIRSYQKIVDTIVRICGESVLADAGIVDHYIHAAADIERAARSIIH